MIQTLLALFLLLSIIFMLRVTFFATACAKFCNECWVSSPNFAPTIKEI